MFSITGAEFIITEEYRKEIKASNKSRLVRLDFSFTGFVPYTGDYYCQVYSPSHFDFGGDDFIIKTVGATSSGDYRAKNTGTIGTLVMSIPTDIEAGADLTFNIFSSRSTSGNYNNP